MKEIIITILNEYTREMEAYSYYGTNPGISEDDYTEIADKIEAKLASLRLKQE